MVLALGHCRGAVRHVVFFRSLQPAGSRSRLRFFPNINIAVHAPQRMAHLSWVSSGNGLDARPADSAGGRGDVDVSRPFVCGLAWLLASPANVSRDVLFSSVLTNRLTVQIGLDRN